MESVSNQSCTTPFPFYELHQVTHTASETATTPSAMDILCEIVNSEYSDVGYNMAPPPVGMLIPRDSDNHHIEKESFLDILYASGSKARKMVAEDVEMLDHEQQALSTTTYSMQFGSNPTNISMPHEFSSPDMHQFKLPLLEQEPESSINNSQLDGQLKTKEIRRNLERSILMCGVVSVTESASALSCMKQGEVKLSSCSPVMMACNEFKAMGTYGYDDERMKDDNIASIKAKGSARPNVDETKLLKRKASTAKEGTQDSSSRKSSVVVARIKHNVSKYSEEGRADKSVGNNAYKMDVEEKSGDERTRGESSLASGGSKRIRVESSLANEGSRRARVEANDEMNTYGAEKAKAGGPRMTHISVERNRRKQMNEHLAILRSLMPTSYVQRSDQASIIGGVVEFIKELQQLLASLETQKRRRAYVAEALSPRVSAGSAGPSPRGSLVAQLSPRGATQELVATSRSPLADVEVKLAGGAHVLLRTLSHKATRGQLLHLIAALECMSLQILHLNITTLQQAVLYTFTLKIGIECRLSVDDLADVGQQIFKDIHAKRL